MCGRFALANQLSSLADIIDDQPSTDFIASIEPSWNIAPTQKVPTAMFDSTSNHFTTGLASWGFRPSWSSPSKIEPINAQIETAATKPMFRQAWATRRCVIPFDGWYEWKSTPLGKQPFYLYVQSEEPVYFAGLWDTWYGDSHDDVLTSTVILTTEAVPSLQEIHHRMPVLVGKSQLDSWFNFGKIEGNESITFTFHAVSKGVNSVQNNGPGLVERIAGLTDYW
jgi:putative SOS response-associated peptidase YedK